MTRYTIKITGTYQLESNNDKDATIRALKHLETDILQTVNSPFRAKEVFNIEVEKK